VRREAAGFVPFGLSLSKPSLHSASAAQQLKRVAVRGDTSAQQAGPTLPAFTNAEGLP